MELTDAVNIMIEQTESLIQKSLNTNEQDPEKASDIAAKVAGEALVLGEASAIMSYAANIAAEQDKSAAFSAQVAGFASTMAIESARKAFASFSVLKAAAELKKFVYTPSHQTKPDPSNRFLIDLFNIKDEAKETSSDEASKFQPSIPPPAEVEDFKCSEVCKGKDCKFMCRTCSSTGAQRCE